MGIPLSTIKAALKAAEPLEHVSLNVGRNVGESVNKLTNGQVEKAIAKSFPGSQIVSHDVIPANPNSHFGPFEPTSRVTIATRPQDLKSQTHSLAENLNQDAIPALNHSTGEAVLAGPKAADWGDKFKQNFFVHPGQNEAHGNQFAQTMPFVHYSSKPGLTELDPSKYGTGMKGAEARRLADAPDIKDRSYFYVDKGANTMRPESGVGGNKYQGKASGIYNLAQDPQGFIEGTREASNNPYLAQQGIIQRDKDLHTNNVERAIKDAGYSGYHTGDTGVLFNKTPVYTPEAQEAYKAQFEPGYYHGSKAHNIESFDPLKSSKGEQYVTPGVTFVTKNIDFAHDYVPTKGTAYKMINEPQQYQTGATIYPLSVNPGKQFDFDTPEGKNIARQFLKEKMIPNNGEEDASRWLEGMQDAHNTWKSLEHPDFLQHLRDTGHDSFKVKEAGIENVGVFSPVNIRGKFAEFNPNEADNPDFMKKRGGLV